MSDNEKNNEEEGIKIVLVGECGVGKTAIIDKYYYNSFSDNYETTVTASFMTKEITINKKKILLKIWDTAGQERYRALTKIFLKNSKIVILVYDITSKSSFDELNFWYDFVQNGLGEKITLGLVGNKADLFENEEVSENEGRELAKKWGALFSVLSAKEDEKGIANFFTKIIIRYSDNIILDEWEVLNKIKTFKIKETAYMENIEGEDNNCCGGGKNKKEKGIKIAFLGSNGVGKTNIINAIRGKPINNKYHHTKKIIKKEINYNLEKKKKVHINLIDTNGDDCKDSEIEKIIIECKIIFLVFDLNNRKSFKDLKNWIKKISVNKNNIKYFCILGNKTNLPKEENNSVTNEEAEEFSKKNGANYLPISIEDISKLQDIIKVNI